VAYLGLSKVSAQSYLKAMCLNLLKAANGLIVPVAAENGFLVTGYPVRKKGIFGTKTADNLCLCFGCWKKGLFCKGIYHILLWPKGRLNHGVSDSLFYWPVSSAANSLLSFILNLCFSDGLFRFGLVVVAQVFFQALQFFFVQPFIARTLQQDHQCGDFVTHIGAEPEEALPVVMQAGGRFA
jgi:IS1106A3 transposase